MTCDRSVIFSGYSGFLHLHDIAEILLKVALNTITLAPFFCIPRVCNCKKKTIATEVYFSNQFSSIIHEDAL
jgi:hypothetical protein